MMASPILILYMVLKVLLIRSKFITLRLSGRGQTLSISVNAIVEGDKTVSQRCARR